MNVTSSWKFYILCLIDKTYFIILEIFISLDINQPLYKNSVNEIIILSQYSNNKSQLRNDLLLFTSI